MPHSRCLLLSELSGSAHVRVEQPNAKGSARVDSGSEIAPSFMTCLTLLFPSQVK
jgi:hypothetical protein